MPYSKTDRQLLRSLGLRIRNLRESKGWSQDELAYRCALHRTYVGGIERGERNVALLNLHKIASALGLSSAELVAQDETPRK